MSVVNQLQTLAADNEEFRFFVKTHYTDKGRQTGYHVHDSLTDQRVALFHNKDHGTWRNAKAAAHNLTRLLNRPK